MRQDSESMAYNIFTGIKGTKELTRKILIGRAVYITGSTFYHIVLFRPSHRRLFLRKKEEEKNLYLISEDPAPSAFKPNSKAIVGTGALNADLQTYLELDIQGYPPLFIDLLPLKRVA